MAHFGAVIYAHAHTVVHVPQPAQMVAVAPVAAFDFGVAVRLSRSAGGAAEIGIFAQFRAGMLGDKACAE